MQKMGKKLLVLIIIAVNCITIMVSFGTWVSNAETSSNVNTKDRLEAIKEKGVLTVASSNDVPFAYIDSKTNEFTGIDAEIISEVARRLGINKVEMKKVAFENLLMELNNNNNIDMVTDGMYVTDERKKEALFTNIWYREPEAIITLKVSRIISKEDLKNAVVGVQLATAFVELAQQWQKDGLVKEVGIFGSKSELLLAVNDGKISGGIEEAVGFSYLIEQNKNLYLKAIPLDIFGEIGAGVRQGDTTLLNAVNEKVDELKKDKTLLKILEKYGLNDSFIIPPSV